MIAIVCALLSGAMFYLSQGMADVWWLAWIAPVPILWLAYGDMRWWTAALTGFAAFALGQSFFFQCYAADMGAAVIGVQVAIFAALFAAAVLFARAVYKRSGAFAALVAFPAGWTTLEYILGSVSPNGTFAALGYSQVSAPFLIQLASLFGLAAVSFLICLFANALALARRGGRNAWIAAAVGFALCILNGVFGTIRLDAPQPATVRVAALADHSDTVAAYKATSRAADVKLASVYAAAIRKAASQGAQLAVTGEGGILTNREWQSAVYAPLAAVAKTAQIEIVAGIAQRDPPADTAITFHPDGRIQTYNKRHLVPGLETRFVPGNGPGLLGHGRATVICKDMDFPATIRSDAENGIRLMAVPAGDFLLDDWIHARMAILRGVENGFAIVRAANRGLVTVSDAQGRVIARNSYQPRGVYSVVADVPLGPGPTLYTRIGDVFAWLAIAVTLLLAALAYRAGRKS
jgi:apolipoprotein N-acyltransferase